MFAANGIAHQVGVAGPTNFGGEVFSYTPYKASATAVVTFNTDGSIAASDGGSPGESLVTDTVSGDAWYSPNTTGIGSSYYIQANGGSWDSLVSPAVWSVSVSGDSQSSSLVLNIQISSSPSGTPVVASGTITLDAQTGNLEIP